MSIVDFQRGMMASRAAGFTIERNLNGAIDEWEAYANRWKQHAHTLEHQYDDLSMTTCFAIGMANGRKDAIDELEAALREINPNHPLLKSGVMDAVVDAGAAEFAASRGCVYDPDAREVRRA